MYLSQEIVYYWHVTPTPLVRCMHIAAGKQRTHNLRVDDTICYLLQYVIVCQRVTYLLRYYNMYTNIVKF